MMKKGLHRARRRNAGRKVAAVALSLAMAAYCVPALALASTDEAVDEQVVAEETVADAAPAVDDGAVADEDVAEDAQADGDVAEDEPAEAAAPAARKAARKAARAAATAGAGGFNVTGVQGVDWDYADGVLTVHGDVTVSTDGQTADSIVIDSGATVTLAGVDIAPSAAAAIAVNPDVAATIVLAEDTTNTVIGGSGHAGVQVSWSSEDLFADLTIVGPGKLNATGGTGNGGAGIGGSYAGGTTADGTAAVGGLHGNVTIKGGTIVSKAAANNSAGIGSSKNPTNYGYVDTKRGVITIDGGSVEAYGNGNGAGIGGGRDMGATVVVNGGTVHAEGDSGIGTGIGSSSGADKGPGWLYAEVTINGGDVTAYATNNMGAGIGGGMYSDARVTITGGTVTASVSLSGKVYQGGAGIGGGYQGAAVVTISGGTVTATGGNGSPGIGNGALATSTTYKKYSESDGWTGSKGVRTGKPTIALEDSGVTITGGTVVATGGYGAAGIGTGNCSERCNVTITGGDVTAIGYASSADEMLGGAGIGTGDSHVPSQMAYTKDTDANIVIGGDAKVKAIGGWGAAGIGSGADNKAADGISIDASNATVEAYADGTKFAIDTRDTAEGVEVEGNVLQGTFVKEYQSADKVDQNPADATTLTVRNDATGDAVELTKPKGYRSFATNVASAGSYTVSISGEESVADGKECYFNVCTTEDFDPDNVAARNVRYVVTSSKLSDNNYLFPVKTIVVTKEVAADASIMDGIDQTLGFALWDNDSSSYVKDASGEYLFETVEVVDGVPQGRAYFSNVEAGTYGVWEVETTVDADGRVVPVPDATYGMKGMAAGTAVTDDITLVGVETLREETDDKAGDSNKATISDELYVDEVTVRNTYAATPEEAPADPVAPAEEPTTITDDTTPTTTIDEGTTPTTSPDETTPTTTIDDEETAKDGGDGLVAIDDGQDAAGDAGTAIDDEDTPLSDVDTGDGNAAGAAGPVGALALVALALVALARRRARVQH